MALEEAELPRRGRNEGRATRRVRGPDGQRTGEQVEPEVTALRRRCTARGDADLADPPRVDR